jgi:hypothetical protein
VDGVRNSVCLEFRIATQRGAVAVEPIAANDDGLGLAGCRDRLRPAHCVLPLGRSNTFGCAAERSDIELAHPHHRFHGPV